MKNLLNIIFLFFLILTTACKDSENGENLKTSLHPDKKIKIVLEAIIPKDDNLSLYYTTDGSINFENKNQLWVPVKGGNEIQHISYDLPEGISEPQIRLDFGMNPKQGDITLKKVTITYGEKYFAVDGAEIFRHFRPDYSKCKVNRKTGQIQALVKNGERQSPSLYPNEKLLAKEIKELIKN